MPRRDEISRKRQLIAQEAARIIAEQGIADFRVAKRKAAERLGFSAHGALPRNPEIEAALIEHQRLFRGDDHDYALQYFREVALQTMDTLQEFRPRLVGPVLSGAIGETVAVNLHLFAETSELVAEVLQQHTGRYQLFERRMKLRREQTVSFPAYRFESNECTVEATIFPVDGIRQAPISPVDGKPMRRASRADVRKLLS